ncbi:DNA repair protein RecN [Ulvibacterium marinum]|uniref:DNA repair protein RecN n=1 Tax=Ulvibacterium marinum TaxID=2419782 RepID=A0A3B0C7X2_9FLAO|nr:DNA repair protein RecN [Ulvibacterium marinum]RKN81510.1 DNA repair protein RecN [Ulvibacterium marinum]
MLNNLLIKNYALIDDINVSFTRGFSCITGETGAGKSILLGGLSLVLGKRADLSSLRNEEKKCIVEAEFEIEKYNLKTLFEENDLDYEPKTIIRREILPSGKSRAFINDTPVTLGILSRLGDRLIDVHSQHQTLRLTENDFQLKVIDALADNKKIVSEYSDKLRDYQNTSKELEQLLEFQKNAIKEHDYNNFLLQELEAAPLETGIQEKLEEQYEQLSNVETILEQLSKGHQLLNDEQVGVINLLLELKQVSGKLSSFGNQFGKLDERIQSIYLEIDDLGSELESYLEQVEANPKLLEETSAKLQLLYDLQKKHGAQDVTELLVIKSELDQKVSATENLDASIAEKEAQLEVKKEALVQISDTLGKRRLKVLPELKQQLEKSLASLGMPSATFKLEIQDSQNFKVNGKNDLVFLFSANAGTDFGDLKKVASGGELSRIMLSIKAVLAQYENLPTIMFDEIDTGVSGEISNKMGDIMQGMSKTMQVFSITHLPQVASKGDHHFKVYKTEENGTTRTQMKKLNLDDRVVELAEMLGGKDLTDSAMAHARQLLN